MARGGGISAFDFHAQDLFDFLAGNSSRTKQGHPGSQVNNRGFDAHLCRATIEHVLHGQLGEHVRGGRRADLAEAIRRRRRHAAVEFAQQCLRPTLSWRPVTKSFAFGERLRIRVRGPGQKRLASVRAAGGISRPHSKAFSGVEK